MEPDAPVEKKPDTGLCAWGAAAFASQSQSALVLNVTFKPLDIFSLRSKLRSTVTPGTPGFF
jgi:hypothetical protein